MPRKPPLITRTLEPASTTGPRRAAIPPEDNIILGLRPILRYLHLRSPLTLYRWVDEWGLPAIKRPDGLWMTSCTALDEWMFLCADLDYKNRRFARGSGMSVEQELKHTAHLPPNHPRRRRALARAEMKTSSKPGPKAGEPHSV